jgi:large subunit ribosomal protein L10
LILKIKLAADSRHKLSPAEAKKVFCLSAVQTFFMAKTKEQKRKILEELKEKIEKQKIMIFIDITGLKSKELFLLRKKLKESGDELKVAKKTLINLILKEKKLDLVDVKKMVGEIALVFGFKDEILPAKTVFEFSKENKNLKILGGILEKNFLNQEKIEELALLPTKEELLVKLIGNIFAPISNFVYVLKSIPQSLIFVLSQIQLKVQK